MITFGPCILVVWCSRPFLSSASIHHPKPASSGHVKLPGAVKESTSLLRAVDGHSVDVAALHVSETPWIRALHITKAVEVWPSLWTLTDAVSAVDRDTSLYDTAALGLALTVPRSVVDLIGTCYGFFVLLFLRHLYLFFSLVRHGSADLVQLESDTKDKTEAESQHWDFLSLMALTSYRFYTGFLSATWLPFVLAKEGAYLWGADQSLFMGLAKLIYGATVLLNPVLGFVGDWVVHYSHGIGRRLYIFCGVTLAASGIVLCLVADAHKLQMMMLVGILLWRMGEAINDVTTEALVPEMVPESQYQVAAAIKASSFLLGGLGGFILLIATAHLHFTWLYYAYLVGMLLAALPSMLLLTKQRLPGQAVSVESPRKPFWTSVSMAYLTPLSYAGGFPKACLAVFLFGCGTSPMFFLLLIVRDILGINDEVQAQQHFAAVSMLFFVSAAVASLLGAARPSGEHDSARGRWTLIGTIICCGVAAVLIPFFTFLPAGTIRSISFYFNTVFYGASFGATFTRFQDVTWKLLPRNVAWANAMGFNVMARNFGVRMGNFVAGLILELFVVDGTDGYQPAGYFVMTGACGVVVLACAYVGHEALLYTEESHEKAAFAET